MINSEFLDSIYKVLNSDGHLFMSTDWENYAESIDESINQNLDFKVLSSSPYDCLLYTSPSPRDKRQSRMPSSA